MPARAVDREPARPAVVAQDRMGTSVQLVPPSGPVAEDRRDQVVPFGEDVGRDDDLLADRPLDREPAAVDLRPDPLDITTRGGAVACCSAVPGPGTSPPGSSLVIHHLVTSPRVARLVEFIVCGSICRYPCVRLNPGEVADAQHGDPDPVRTVIELVSKLEQDLLSHEELEQKRHDGSSSGSEDEAVARYCEGTTPTSNSSRASPKARADRSSQAGRGWNSDEPTIDGVVERAEHARDVAQGNLLRRAAWRCDRPGSPSKSMMMKSFSCQSTWPGDSRRGSGS